MQTTKFALKAHTNSKGYTFPSLYSWEPFFTKQRHPTSLSHQILIWSQLILSYCRFHRIFRLEITEGALDGGETKELWGNETLHRRVNLSFAKDIIASLVASGSAEYDVATGTKKFTSSTSSSVFIYWRRPEEWGSVIYDWVVDNGLNGSIMTFYELTEGGSLAPTTEFYKLPTTLLRKSLQTLIKQGKAQIFNDDGPSDDGDDEEGVKFF